MDSEFVKYATYVTGGLLVIISTLLALIGKNFNKHVTAVRVELRELRASSTGIEKALVAQGHSQTQALEALAVSSDALRALLAHEDPQLGLTGIQSIPLLRAKVDEVLEGQEEQRKAIHGMDMRLMLIQRANGLLTIMEKD